MTSCHDVSLGALVTELEEAMRAQLPRALRSLTPPDWSALLATPQRGTHDATLHALASVPITAQHLSAEQAVRLATVALAVACVHRSSWSRQFLLQCALRAAPAPLDEHELRALLEVLRAAGDDELALHAQITVQRLLVTVSVVHVHETLWHSALHWPLWGALLVNALLVHVDKGDPRAERAAVELVTMLHVPLSPALCAAHLSLCASVTALHNRLSLAAVLHVLTLCTEADKHWLLCDAVQACVRALQVLHVDTLDATVVETLLRLSLRVPHSAASLALAPLFLLHALVHTWLHTWTAGVDEALIVWATELALHLSGKSQCLYVVSSHVVQAVHVGRARVCCAPCCSRCSVNSRCLIPPPLPSPSSLLCAHCSLCVNCTALHRCCARRRRRWRSACTRSCVSRCAIGTRRCCSPSAPSSLHSHIAAPRRRCSCASSPVRLLDFSSVLLIFSTCAPHV